MDKIRLSISSKNEDFARLYNAVSGFYGEQATVTFPSSDSLNLFFSSFRRYEVSISGDCVLRELKVPRFMRYFSISWTEKAKQAETGEALLTICNPEYPDRRSVFRLVLREFSYEYQTPENNYDNPSVKGDIASAVILDVSTLKNSSLSYYGEK